MLEMSRDQSRNWFCLILGLVCQGLWCQWLCLELGPKPLWNMSPGLWMRSWLLWSNKLSLMARFFTSFWGSTGTKCRPLISTHGIPSLFPKKVGPFLYHCLQSFPVLSALCEFCLLMPLGLLFFHLFCLIKWVILFPIHDFVTSDVFCIHFGLLGECIIVKNHLLFRAQINWPPQRPRSLVPSVLASAPL